MKFYFYYGVMNSSKTANALMKKFNFEECKKKVALIKPSIDTRDGELTIKSRAGLESKAYVINKDSTFTETLGKNHEFDTLIIDEAQFLTVKQVDELREMVNNGIMVMCYGLKTDFTGHLFEGSKRLVEICDTIREIQSMCSKCKAKAIMNALHLDGKQVLATIDGSNIVIGGDEKFTSLCHKCWSRNT